MLHCSAILGGYRGCLACALAPIAQVPQHKMRYALLVLSTLVLLFLIFALGVWAARALRRGRERLTRKPADPTEYVDAWSMHKLPEDLPPLDPDEPP